MVDVRDLGGAKTGTAYFYDADLAFDCEFDVWVGLRHDAQTRLLMEYGRMVYKCCRGIKKNA